METKTSIDKIDVTDQGIVQVRVRTSEFENEVETKFSLHRYAILPGDDYSAEPDEINKVCAKTHSQEVIDAYKESAFTPPTQGV